MLILILKLVQSVFVCVYTPKQTFELIYIRLKPQAYVSHPAAYVWKIVCTWFVNFDLVCTDDIQQIVNLYNQPQTTSPIICVLATCRQAILTSASPRSRLLVCRWLGHRLLDRCLRFLYRLYQTTTLLYLLLK